MKIITSNNLEDINPNKIYAHIRKGKPIILKSVYPYSCFTDYYSTDWNHAWGSLAVYDGEMYSYNGSNTLHGQIEHIIKYYEVYEFDTLKDFCKWALNLEKKEAGE